MNFLLLLMYILVPITVWIVFYKLQYPKTEEEKEADKERKRNYPLIFTILKIALGAFLIIFIFLFALVAFL